jgi:hypothetical protein
MMSWVSVEQTEEPLKSEHHYIPTSFPTFKKKDNPVSDLSGESVFLQDEQGPVQKLGFEGQEAASVLSAEVQLCRHSHQGNVLRQRINVERCSIIEYHYRFERKDYSIYVNPDKGFVEDVSGPIQAGIEKMDALAQQAFDERRYEEAYRFNLRSLCMDEPSEQEKKLRDQILKRLTAAYRKPALLTWFVASVAWLMTAPGEHGSFGGFLLGALLLISAVHLFARDMALRLQRRSSRIASAILIGVSCFLSVSLISNGSIPASSDNWSDWLPFLVVTVALVLVAVARAKERRRRTEIENYLAGLPDNKARESYVIGIDPAERVELGTLLGLSAVMFCMLGLVVGLSAYHSSKKVHPSNLKAEESPTNLSGAAGTSPAASSSESGPRNVSPAVEEIVKLKNAHMSDDLILRFATNADHFPKLSAAEVLYLV